MIDLRKAEQGVTESLIHSMERMIRGWRGSNPWAEDAIGLPSLFGIKSSAALFEDQVRQVHFTSVLRYPVMVRGEMLGDATAALTSPLLRRWLEYGFLNEVELLKNSLFLPLGRGARKVTRAAGDTAVRVVNPVSGRRYFQRGCRA